VSLLLLVDGDGLLYRAAHAIPHATNAHGLPTNGLFGFAGMIWALRARLAPTHMAVAFTADPPLRKHALDPAYKINHYEHPPEIKAQLPYAVRFVRAAGAQPFLEPGYEADDVLATLARRERRRPVRIVSSDRDFYQLVSARVLVLRPVRGVSEMQTVDLAAVRAAFGVEPDQIADLKALTGDSSDDIPGVRGIGPKTAAALLRRHRTVEALLAADGAGEARLGPLRERILLNKALALPLDVPLPAPVNLAVRPPDEAALRALAEETAIGAVLPPRGGGQRATNASKPNRRRAATARSDDARSG
jgi:DNA polymerase-1